MTESRARNGQPALQRARALAYFVDYCWLGALIAGLTPLFLSDPKWSPLVHLGGPVLLYLPVSYVLLKLRGATPGQSLVGLQARTSEGALPQRIYDWLFGVRFERSGSVRSLAGRVALAIGAAVLFLGGASSLWFHDPTLRPWPESTVPLFAPGASETQAWEVLPFFYTTGALPRARHPELKVPAADHALSGLEYSLPYERGPPQRFLGRVIVYWRALDSTLNLTGPMTAASPASADELRRCSQRWFGCYRARRKIWSGSIGRWFREATVEESRWFEVENGFIDPTERPRGLYVRSRAPGERVREGYFLVGPKMAVQGFVLDRPTGATGAQASKLLAEAIGSARVSGDLQAPRAFLNPKLAALRIGPRSSLAEMVDAEAALLAKVSIEPKDPESFYHLAGLSVTLFREAKARGSVELAATSKATVTNALKFLRDIEPRSPRIPEMERFDAEVEAR